MRQPIPMNLQQARMNRNMLQPAVQRGMPNINAGIMNISDLKNIQGPTSNFNQSSNAQKIGSNLLQNSGLNAINFSDENSIEKVKSLATDNEDEVDDSLKSFYNQNPELSKLFGGILSVTDSTDKLVKLYEDQAKGLVKTPEEAKNRVKEFFPSLKKKEVPVWADVATNVGIELIKSGDLGTALEVGQKTAQAGRAKKSQRDFMLDQMAFGIFKEDTKQAQNIATNVAKLSIEQDKNAITFSSKVTDYLLKSKENDDKLAKAKSDSIFKVINSYPKEYNNEIRSLVAKHLPNLSDKPLDEIPNILAAKINSELGTIMQGETDLKFIESKDFKITDQENFVKFQQAYPEIFKGITFEPDKEYTISLALDKRNLNKSDYLFSGTGINVNVPLGTTTGFTKLINEFNNASDQLNSLPAGHPDKDKLTNNVRLLQDRLDKLTKEEPTKSFFITEDGVVQIEGTDVAGAMNSVQLAQALPPFNQKRAAFARFANLGYNALVALEKFDPGGEAIAGGGVTGLSRLFTGINTQIESFKGTFSEFHPEQGQQYIDGANTSFNAFYNNREKITLKYGGGSTTVGEVFKKFDEAIGDNRELRSILTDMAFALASTRETGKLTDKDVAAALNTIGGDALVEKALLPTKRDLISGLNTALNSVHIDLGSQANMLYEPARKLAESKGEDITNTQWDPISTVKLSPNFSGDFWRNQVVQNKKFGTLSFNSDLVIQDALEYKKDRQNQINDTGNAQLYNDTLEAIQFIQKDVELTRELRESKLKEVIDDFLKQGGDSIKLQEFLQGIN